ncbi:MAG: hypothetical protein JOZ68_08530 [Acidimicrobiia bacterium]|nr:hypothetical protein [Acidimicrobiia bacterium]
MRDNLRGRRRRMGGVLYVLVMVAVVMAVDVLLFRSKTWFWERLAANVGIVLLFGAFYFRFLGSS